jgi:cyclic-di-AMP phosphodiesterase PgpH
MVRRLGLQRALFAWSRGWETDEQRQRLWALGLALVFLVLLTLILSLDVLLPDANQLANLQIGDVLEGDVRAPRTITYVSQSLTERARATARDSVAPIYDPPDPNIARQQLDLARVALDYVANVRFDTFGTRAQKLDDLAAISAFTLESDIAQRLLEADDAQWRNLDSEIMTVLERILREPIREDDLGAIRDQLPMQVSVRFDARTSAIITSIVEDLIRPNMFRNPDATEAARRDAALAVSPETRSFEQGQVVVRGGTRLDDVDYEALATLGLLETADTRWQMIGRSLLASVVVMVSIGLYIVRFQPELRQELPMLALIACLFLLAVLGMQVFTDDGQFYLYPAAALALLLVSLAQVELAIVCGLALAILFGLMSNLSLESASLTAFGSLIGAVSLRQGDRVNTYFIAGLMIALINFVVLTLFNLQPIAAGETGQLGILMIYSLINGLFAAATALAGMYIVTLLFNLPTNLKLVELSQTSQPLLQRLLREAPGTYQHSLQVANLSEQAATAISANAPLVRVAALYHDIGKMLNPAFFVENQAESANPHEQLNDPYRSADIIISHVTDGERLAKQYQLPARIRDFIIEHHGTTLVNYFYRKALDTTTNPDSVDINDFRYHGPRPRSRETAILMLADTCESTVRARKPSNRQQVAEIVDEMVDTRLRDGQLDDSNLTSRELKTIRAIFIEMLQAVFHPRINYPSLPTQSPPAPAAVEKLAPPKAPEAKKSEAATAPIYYETPDDVPLPEVPPLRRVSKTDTGEISISNGSAKPSKPEEAEQGDTDNAV